MGTVVGMTIAQMRELLGLGEEHSDAYVVMRYALHIGAASSTPAAAVPPITLEAAKRHLKVDTDADDSVITDLLAAATDEVERATGLYLSRRAFAVHADGFDRWIDLSPWPIKTIDAISYVDGAGADQVLDAAIYRVADGRRPARIVPVASWPRARAFRGSVVVTGTAGFDGPEDVPPSALQAIRVVLAEFYQNREAGALSDAAQRSVAWLTRNLKVKRL